MEKLKLEIKKLESRETKACTGLCSNSGNVCSTAFSMDGSPTLCLI